MEQKNLFASIIEHLMWLGKLRSGPFRESVHIFLGSVQNYCTSYDNNKRPAELSRSRDPARLSTVEDALLSRSHDNNRTAEYHTPHLMEDLDKNLSTHLTSPKLAAPGSQP